MKRIKYILFAWMLMILAVSQAFSVFGRSVSASPNMSDISLSSMVSLAVPDTDTVKVQICQGQTLTVGSTEYNEAGFYSEAILQESTFDTLTILVYELTVVERPELVDTTFLCRGESEEYACQTWTDNATIIRYEGPANTCETKHIHVVQMDTARRTATSVTVCQNHPYQFYTKTIKETGWYNDTITGGAGVCDSIISIYVNVLDTFHLYFDSVMCYTGTVDFEGETYSNADMGDALYTDGVYYKEFSKSYTTADGGCDSIRTLRLTMKEPVKIATPITQYICYGDTLRIGDAGYEHLYYETAVYTDTVRTRDNVCDSIYTQIDLTVAPQPEVSGPIDIEICTGNSIFIGGGYQTEAGPYRDTLYNEHMCHSKYIDYNLSVVDQVVVHDPHTICRGDSVLIDCEWKKEEGTYNHLLTGYLKCDTLVITTIKFDTLTRMVDSVVCAQAGAKLVFYDEDVPIDPSEVTADGDTTKYPHYILGGIRDGVAVCDSIVTLRLIVNPVPELDPVSDVVLCNKDSMLVPLTVDVVSEPHTTYSWTITGDAEVVLTDANGNVLANNSGDSIPKFEVKNESTSQKSKTITVIPEYNRDGKKCAGDAQTFMITVNPSADVVAMRDTVVCNGTALTLDDFSTTNTDGTTTYSWKCGSEIGLDDDTGERISFTATNTGLSPVTKTVTVYSSYENDAVICAGDSIKIDITVNPTATATPIDTTVCNAVVLDKIVTTSNTSGTVTYAWTGGSEIGLVDGSGSTISFTTTNASVAPVTKTITITPTFTNAEKSCVGSPVTADVTVNPTAAMNALRDTMICNAATLALAAFSTTNEGGTVTYAWTGANAIGLADGSAASAPSFTAVNTTNAAIEKTLTVTPTFTNNDVACTGPVQSMKISVNPTANVTVSTDKIVVCNGETVPAITFNTLIEPALDVEYTWSNKIDIGNGVSVETTTAPVSYTAVNVGFAPMFDTLVVVPTLNIAGESQCPGIPDTTLIIVNPSAHVNAIGNDTVCSGVEVLYGPFTSNNIGGGTVTYSWDKVESIGLNADGTGNSISFTTSNPTSAEVTADITVTPTYTYEGKSCTGTPMVFSVTVSPDPVVASTPIDVQICSGSNIFLAGAYQNTSGPYRDTIYNERYCAAKYINYNLTVIDQPIVYDTVVICRGDSVQIDCEWKKDEDTYDHLRMGYLKCDTLVKTTVEFDMKTRIVDTAVCAVVGGKLEFYDEDVDIDPANVTADGEITEIDHYIMGGLQGGIPVCDSTITLRMIVNPVPVLDPLRDTILCNRDSLQVLLNVDNVALPHTTYSWTIAGDAEIELTDAAGNPVTSNIGTAIPKFAAKNSSTASKSLTITVEPIYSRADHTCTGVSESFILTVNPAAEVHADVDTVVVCVEDNVPAIHFATYNSVPTTYTWTNRVDIGNGVGSGTGNTGEYTAVNAGNEPLIDTIIVTPKLSGFDLDCEAVKDTVIVIVNPKAKLALERIDTTLCNTDSVRIPLQIEEAERAYLTYQWSITGDAEVEMTDAGGIAMATTGEAASIPVFEVKNASTSPKTITIAVTPKYTNYATVCTGDAVMYQITVNPVANVDAINDTTVCRGETLTLANFSTTNTGGTTTYAWTGGSEIGLDDGQGDHISFVAQNDAVGALTRTVTVNPTFTNNGKTCSGVTMDIDIMVNPKAHVSLTETKQVLCNADSLITTLNTEIAEDPYLTYTWIITADAEIIMTDRLGNPMLLNNTADSIPVFEVVNTSIEPKFATLAIVPIYTNGNKSCEADTLKLAFTVNPKVSVDPVADQVYSNGEVAPVTTFTSPTTSGTIAYDWGIDDTSIGIPSQTGTGDIPSYTVTNFTTGVKVGNVAVVPTFTYDGTSCVGDTTKFTITVNPTATVEIVNKNQLLCANDTTKDIIFKTSAVNGKTKYQWTNNQPTIGLVASGECDTIYAFKVFNPTDSIIRAEIRVVPIFTYAGVETPGIPDTAVLIIYPTAIVNALASQTHCMGESTNEIQFVSSQKGGTFEYEWFNDNTDVGLSATGTGSNIASFVTKNDTRFPIVANLQVVPTYKTADTICVGDTATMSITVNPIIKDTIPQLICYDDIPYTYGNNTNILIAGYYNDTLQTVFGCDSIVTMDLHITPDPIRNTIPTQMCYGEYFNGVPQYASFNYNDTIPDQHNCDSIINTYAVSIHVPTVVTVELDICTGDSVYLENAYRKTANTYRDTIYSADFCMDYFVDTKLTVTDQVVVEKKVDLCPGDSVLIGCTYQKVGNIYYDLKTDPFKCDTLVRYDVTVNPVYHFEDEVTICDDELPYKYGDSTFVQAGVKDVMFQTIKGCDSLITVTLNVNPTYHHTDEATVCASSLPYQYGDTTFVLDEFTSVNSLTKDVVFHTVDGCDSTITFTLNVDKLKKEEITTSICQGESYKVNGKPFDKTGVYIETLKTVALCDSMVILNLTVVDTTREMLSVSICNGDTFRLNGQGYAKAGTYKQELKAASGCDSLLVLTLTVNDPHEETIEAVICRGESYKVNGKEFSETGIYVEHLETTKSCDSTITLDLTVLDPDTGIYNQETCERMLTINGYNYNETGTYTQHLKSAQGCDSVLILNLVFNKSYAIQRTVTIKEGESYYVGGDWQTKSGSYVDYLKTVADCDSVVYTKLTVLPVSKCYDTRYITACEQYYVGGDWQTESGVYFDSLRTDNCDSLITTILTIGHAYQQEVTHNICEGEKVTIGGVDYYETGIHYEYLGTVLGCDSVVEHMIIVSATLPAISLGNDTMICRGDKVMLDVGDGLWESIVWQDGTTDAMYEVTESGEYSVVVSYECGEYSDTIIVNVEDCNYYLWLPDAFTPNSDGLNDLFEAIGIGITEYHIYIYSRWGQLIFEGNDINDSWDGRYQGEKVQMGVYTYYIRFKTTLDTRERTRSGIVTVVRD